MRETRVTRHAPHEVPPHPSLSEGSDTFPQPPPSSPMNPSEALPPSFDKLISNFSNGFSGDLVRDASAALSA